MEIQVWLRRRNRPKGGAGYGSTAWSKLFTLTKGSRLPAHQPSVYGMAWVGWRDRKAPWMAHYEPPWVRTHCLRGTASHAFERTAASGWAGPRSGVHSGSRDPTHAVPPRVTRKCGFGFGFGFRFRFRFRFRFGVGPSSSCHQLHPPQPAEHPPRYTQAIASPPGPLKPCNINGLKGKSAP